MNFSLISPAFAPEATLPERYTCRGAGLLPPLVWSGAPENTATFALILEDPDAPGGMFRHFGAYNIPGDTRELPEGNGALVNPVQPVLHDFGSTGLFPPCPPPVSGTHRYHFRLFALGAPMSFERPPTCQGMIAMIQRDLLEDTVLVANCAG